MKKFAKNWSHKVSGTYNMGLNYPSFVVDALPGTDIKLNTETLARTMPQISPTMHNVRVGLEYYEVPWRQIFDELGLNWDRFLSGGPKGDDNQGLPLLIYPAAGYDDDSLISHLGYPSNYTDPETGELVIVGGIEVNAMRLLAYLHIINKYKLDRNFLEEIDLSQYQSVANGTYAYKDIDGNVVDSSLVFKGIFPQAWPRDYFGSMLPNTQRGPQAQLPLSGSAVLSPLSAPVRAGHNFSSSSAPRVFRLHLPFTAASIGREYLFQYGGKAVSGVLGGFAPGSGAETSIEMRNPVFDYADFSGSWSGSSSIGTLTIRGLEGGPDSVYEYICSSYVITSSAPDHTLAMKYQTLKLISGPSIPTAIFTNMNAYLVGDSPVVDSAGDVADLSGVSALLSSAVAAGIIDLRLASRMQYYGEKLLRVGWLAVEYTMGFFGVRVPDARMQLPVFHGATKIPIIFSEVLQTSNTNDVSPQGNLAGHGIGARRGRPVFIRMLEHCTCMSLLNIMPEAEYHNITPASTLWRDRFDLPLPAFQHVGDRSLLAIELFPQSSEPYKVKGYVPRYSELAKIPSRVVGGMKSHFLHWKLCRVYKSEPNLNAAWRYEKPSNRSFAVQNEDGFQLTVGYAIDAFTCFGGGEPGIHIL